MKIDLSNASSSAPASALNLSCSKIQSINNNYSNYSFDEPNSLMSLQQQQNSSQQRRLRIECEKCMNESKETHDGFIDDYESKIEKIRAIALDMDSNIIYIKQICIMKIF